MFYLISFVLLLLKFFTCTKNDIIDYKRLESIQNSIKNVDSHEFENTFKMFVDAAGFDDLIENYTKKVKKTIEKRINDALILK